MQYPSTAVRCIGLAKAFTLCLMLPAPAQTPDICGPAQNGAQLTGVTYDAASGYLTDVQLSTIAAQYTGCPLTEPVVGALLDAVNALYTTQGIDLAFAQFGAVSPDGVVTVDLVEIRYGAITVTGNDDTDAGYVQRRAGAVMGDLADITRLGERLATLPETDDIRITADLKPGAAEGTSDLTLDVVAPDPTVTTLTLDDDGSVETGRERISLVHRIASVSGLRDPLSLSITKSQGSTSGSVGYARPVGRDGVRLSGSITVERSRFVNAQPALRALRSTSNSIALGAAIPMGAGDYGNDFINIGVQFTDDDTDLTAVKITDQETVELSFGTSHLRRTPGVSVIGLSHGLRFGRLDDAVVGDRSMYLRHDATLFGAVLLSDDWTFNAEFRTQFTSHSLPSAAQFSIVGDAGVRGYPSSEGSADGGILTRLELRRTAGEAGISPAIFADAGASFTRSGGTLTQSQRLKSVGGTLEYRGETGLNGTLIVAFPFVDTTTFNDSGAPQISLRLGKQF